MIRIEQRSVLVRELLDDRASPIDRAVAARLLAEHPAMDTVDALLKVANDGEPNELVSFAAGESIAEILLARGETYEAPLVLFDTAMAEAFDATIARRERTQAAASQAANGTGSGTG